LLFGKRFEEGVMRLADVNVEEARSWQNPPTNTAHIAMARLIMKFECSVRLKLRFASVDCATKRVSFGHATSKLFFQLNSDHFPPSGCLQVTLCKKLVVKSKRTLYSAC
jgi:hypothetical protein